MKFKNSTSMAVMIKLVSPRGEGATFEGFIQPGRHVSRNWYQARASANGHHETLLKGDSRTIWSYKGVQGGWSLGRTRYALGVDAESTFIPSIPEVQGQLEIVKEPAGSARVKQSEETMILEKPPVQGEVNAVMKSL